MAKQLNVDLRFNADVSQAKAQLQSLQQSLNNLTMTTAGQLNITPQIKEAQQAAVHLKTALQQSMDINTGKFDLSKFNSSLKTMGTDLNKIKTQMISIGPTGQQAFMQLAQSIMTAEIPTKRVNALFSQLGVTIKNTAKWQISSSILHGFMGAVSTAYNYAKDLNSSLNDIRIVTEQSAEQMDKFALRANKAAKALSTSTLEYTKASLIYYQQGLSDKAVEERTNATIKMANVTGQNAENVSDQMTAIWNNFAKAGDNLEYYADVVTALGAATASSSDEIAQGLEKFAAVADTVGLSYEYATAALATVTSQTRQSADVVGTAFKTLFARIQDLDLGKTLDDGTTLGSYSEALNKVGINIKDQFGNLKDMNAILQEMGGKWETLNKDQQVALAKSVAGVRQYSQLIALMDNWDLMEQNVTIAKGAEGTLTTQADIYEESWEAASKRVKAAMESIYTDLLDDDFFIDLTDSLAEILGYVDKLLDSMGGAKGLLTGLSSILLHMFAGSAAKGLENMVYNFKSFVGLAEKEALQTKNNISNLVTDVGSEPTTDLLGNTIQPSATNTASITGIQQQIELEKTLLGVKDQLSEQDQLQVKNIMEQNRAYAEQLQKLGELKDASDSDIDEKKTDLQNGLWGTLSQEEADSIMGEVDEQFEYSDLIAQELQEADQAFLNAPDTGRKAYLDKLNELKQKADEMYGKGSEVGKAIEARKGGKKGKDVTTEDLVDSVSKKTTHTSEVIAEKAKKDITKKVKKATKRDDLAQSAEDYVDARRKGVKIDKDFAKGQDNLRKKTEESKNAIVGLKNSTQTWSQTIVGVSQGVMSLSFAFNSLKSLGSTWADETLSGGEKLLQTFMSLGMAIPMIMNGFSGLAGTLGKTNLAYTTSNALLMTKIGLSQKELLATDAETLAKQKNITVEQAQLLIDQARASQILTTLGLSQAELASMTAEELAAKKGISVKTAQLLLDKALVAGKGGLIAGAVSHTAALIVEALAAMGLNTAMAPVLAIMLLIAAAIAAVVAIGWLLSKAFKAIAASTPEGKLKAAQERSKELNEQLKKVTETSQKLKDSFNKYDEISKKLAQCTKGTKEWNDALAESNLEVLNLLDQIPELATMVNDQGESAISRDADGKLVVADWARDQVLAQSAQEEAIAQAASFIGKQDVRDAQLAVDKKTANSLLGTVTVGSGEYATYVNASKIYDDLAASGNGTVSEESYAEALRAQGVYESDIKRLIGNMNDYAKAVEENKLAEENNKIIKQQENETVARQALQNSGDWDKYKDSKVAKAIASASGEAFEDAYEAEMKKLKDDGWGTDGISQADGANDEAKKIWREYEKAVGNTVGTLTDTTGDDSERKFVYEDAEGEEQEVSLEVMRQTVATARAIESLGTSAAKAAEILSNFTKVNLGNGKTQTESEIETLLAFLNDKNFNNAKLGGVDNLVEQFSPTTTTDESGKTKIDLDDEKIKTYFADRGIADDATAQAAFGKNLTDLLADFENTLLPSLNYINDAMAIMTTDGVNSQGKVVSESLGFSEGTAAKALEGLTQDEAERLLNTLQSGEVSEAVREQFIKGIEEAGSSGEIKDIINNFIGTYGDQSDKFAAGRAKAESLGLDPDIVETQAKQLLKLNKELNGNAEAAMNLAIRNQKLNKGINTLSDNWEDWGKILKKANKENGKSLKGTQDYAEALDGVKEALVDVLGVTDKDFFSDDFFEDAENLKLIEQAANGSEQAVSLLGIKAAQAQLATESLNEDLVWYNQLGEHTKEVKILTVEDFNTAKQQVESGLNDLFTKVQNGSAKSGQALSEIMGPEKTKNFIDGLNTMAMATNMTVDQMQEKLNAMGITADVTTAEKTITTKKPVTETTVTEVSPGDENGVGRVFRTVNRIVDYTPVDEKIQVAQINMGDAAKGTLPTFHNAGNISPSSTTDGKKGGGSKPKSTKEARQKKTDIVDRYKEINDQLAKTQRLMDKNSTLADTLWGPDKVEKIQENIDALETYNKQLEQKIQLQKQYLAEDKTALTDAASAVGLNFSFGEDGTILNYTTEMTKLHNQREALLDSFGATIDEKEQKKLEDLDKQIEAVTDAYGVYEETLNEGFELDQEKLENQIEQMQQRFEALELKVEIQVELNENDIADIEHKLERLGENNVYSAAERIVLIQQNASSYKNIANAQMDGIKEAETLYAAGDITQADYMQRLQEGKEALQEAEMSIRDGIAQIGDELENTFNLVDEKLDQQFIKFDQMIELMEHYKNVVSLTQGEASYKEFNEILKTSQKVLRDRIAAGESEVAMWKARREDLEAQIATLPEGEAKREAEEALQVIMEKEADAKSQLMADIEQLGEYAREIFENSVEQAIIDFEDNMFDRPLNSIIEGIEMMNARQEELLTTTNKIYETDKLIRNIEKDIESTSNTRAKQALAEFQNKVKQKQEQNELTKFELDLLNAEYEITKAQIALEEAQNAKDTVRLTRDSEGNFGYVYTANEDKVADAEQALDDATNNYYNTAMEGAQKYQDQIYQHIQEWEEKVKEVYLDQTLSEEEKNAKIKEINDTYNALITQDKELYYMAVGAMQESSYNNQVDYDLKGIASAENWYDNCDQFLEDLEGAQDEYDANTKEVAGHTEKNFGTMETAINDTKTASENLKDQIVNDLVPELNTTLKEAIGNATGAWLDYIDALKEAIRLTDEAMTKNKNAKEKEIEESGSSGDKDSKDTDDSETDQTPPEVEEQSKTPELSNGSEVIVKSDVTHFSSKSDNKKMMKGVAGNKFYVAKIDGDQIRLKDPHGPNYTAKGITGWVKKTDLVGFATGGYTGEWGPEGKLAMLHQKELVLNADDTENFLMGIQMLRSISQILDRNAALASMTSSNLSAYTLSNSFGQTLEQEVTIHAEFPNVSDHNEIEIAIDNLINRASQYSYKS